MVVYIAVQNEADLIPHYSEPLLYIHSFKAFLSFGHFVLVEMENDVVIGQLLRRDAVANNVLISVFLPLYDTGTRQHINLSPVLPETIIHPSCVNTTELISISKVAIIPVCCIRKLAFVFLESDVAEYTFHVQGIQEAFLIRFKYCFQTCSLVKLNKNTFF